MRGFRGRFFRGLGQETSRVLRQGAFDLILLALLLTLGGLGIYPVVLK